MTSISQRYAIVQERIARAALRAGRRPEDITLVAVTKTWPVEVVLTAHEVGMRHFGENRAEELAQKRPALEDALGSSAGVCWHQIGTLQSRKTSLTADHADYFHALDRYRIARRLSQRLQENGRSLTTFLEVNISGEASKSGFNASNWENDATQRRDLRNVVQAISELPGLDLQGLMTMAPWGAPAASIQALFARTRELSHWLQTQVPEVNLSQLSMGMTDDFEIAIAEGATHVRVGRALFGARS